MEKLNQDQVIELARAAISAQDGRVGVQVDDLTSISQWVSAALQRQGSYCDASAVAKKLSLPRRSWLGLPSTAISGTVAPLTANIVIQADQIFIGTSLRLPADTVAGAIDILALKVGAMDQMVQYPVPGSIFSELSLAAQIDMDLCTSGQKITLTVENISGGDITFRGAYGGFTIQGC